MPREHTIIPGGYGEPWFTVVISDKVMALAGILEL